MKVSFMGLGAMGYPMAGHLAKKFETVVWNRTAAVAERHAAEFGSLAAASPAEAADADVIMTCLPTSVEVNAVVDAGAGSLRSRAVWADCTSGHPDMARATAHRLKQMGVHYLDTPVSGGVNGAKAGTLAVMAGGDAAVLERARPGLEAFAARIFLVGGVGAGHEVKAVNNVLMALNVWSACEGLLALDRLGVDQEAALAAINASSGRSNATENLLPRPLATGEHPLMFKLALLHKDAGIAADVARAAGCPSPLIALVTQLLGAARSGLAPDADYTEILRALRAWQTPMPPPPTG